MAPIATLYITIQIDREHGRSSPTVRNPGKNWKVQPMHIILDTMTKTTIRSPETSSVSLKQMEKPMCYFRIQQHKWEVLRSSFRSGIFATAIKQIQNMERG